MTRDTLRRRFAKHLVLPLLVMYAISGGLAYWVARHYANEVYDHWLFDSAMSLAHQVRLSGGHAALNLPRVAQQIFEWDDEDATLFRVTGSSSGEIAGEPDVPLDTGTGVQFRNAVFYDAPARGHAMRWASVMLDAGTVGETVTVIVGETMRKREHLQEEILLAVLGPQLIVMLLLGLVTYRAIAGQTHRVHVLSQALHDLSVTRLHPVPHKDMPEELLPLTDALNAMLAKVDRAAIAQRSFVANAAHQLRTPLTTINLLAEQARHSATIDEMRSAVAALQVAASRTARLANQLLLLSRAEPDAQSAHHRAVVDLHALAFETAREWAGKAIASGIDLGFDDSSVHVAVEVDGALIREAINNLLDNALKYCPRGTRVTVAVSLLPDPTVIVEDSGPGIAESERSRVVKRFHRGDNVTQSGTGLGLAIVNEIALAHSGRFVIRDAAGGGARFEIHLPAGSAPSRQAGPSSHTSAVSQA